MQSSQIFLKNSLYSILLLTIMCMMACKPSKEEDSEDKVVLHATLTKPEVEVAALQSSDFSKEIISNGRVNAKEVAVLKFLTQDVIERIFVFNGKSVKKGEKIAELNNYFLKKGVEQAKNALGRTKLEYQDILIGQGYKLSGMDSVPQELKELARIKSGLNAAETQYEMALYSLKQSALFSPINGQIANLFAKPNTIAVPGETFCQVIDTKNLEVVFPMLESELLDVRVGSSFKVIPFSDPSVETSGIVTEINPTVDGQGMIKVKGVIIRNASLIDGMNVHISLRRFARRQLVVPKEAVVQRAGRQVVFSVSNGRAKWNDVVSKMENSKEYAVESETLRLGDTVVCKGNLTLAHDAEVKIVKKIHSDGQQ